MKANQKNVGPVTTAATAAAALVLIVCYVIEVFSGHTVPTEVQGAAAVVLVALAGYLVPSKENTENTDDSLETTDVTTRDRTFPSFIEKTD